MANVLNSISQSLGLDNLYIVLENLLECLLRYQIQILECFWMSEQIINEIGFQKHSMALTNWGIICHQERIEELLYMNKRFIWF